MTNYNKNTLWMGDLESYMDERFVFQAFEQMGEAVVKVKLVASKHVRGLAGYCFVEFTDSDASQKAMLRLNGKIIPGSAPPKRFKLNRASFSREHLAVPEFSLFVGDVSDDIDDYKLYTMFSSKYISCKSAKVVLDSAGKSRGYGFVRFLDETDQQRALIEMHGYSGINQKPLRVSLATPKKSNPIVFDTPRYESNSFYHQQPYPNYQPYYGSDYASAAWWQAYQQPMDPSVYYGTYVGSSYWNPEQAAASSSTAVLLSELNYVAPNTPEDDETSDPGIAVDVQLSNHEFIEKSEEFYVALDESRWHPLDNVSSTILST